LLRAVKSKAIVWQATTLPAMDISIEHIGLISAGRSGARYVMFVERPHSPVSYQIHADFDGTSVVVKRVAIGEP
jgi:hypothetical protein